MIGAKVPDSAVVIDIDPRNGGSLEALETITGTLPDTLTAWSGRNDGGRHLYFKRPAGQLTSSKLPDGIDLKVNGYCIAPPSIHPVSGEPYRWDHHELARPPHALRELLRPTPKPATVYRGDGGNGAGLVRTVAEAPERKRHNALVWASYRARDDGILDKIADELVAAAVAAGGEPKPALAA
jgi:Bifunctional DNA primase/polymerase, N-terminal